MMMDLGFSEINTRMRKSLVANPLACTGCRTCEAACSLVKTGLICPDKARLYIDRDPFEGSFVPNVCHQCSTPYCLKACPADAIGIYEKNGVVGIDYEKCSGCGLCQKACPYGMIIIEEDPRKAFKCDLCGGDPRCVKACPVNVLGIAYFGDKKQK